MSKQEEHDSSLIEKLRNVFVSTEVFNLRMSPIEKIVYGMATVIGLAFVGAVVSLVIGVKK